jgi:CRISPR-associated Csx2 family protein
MARHFMAFLGTGAPDKGYTEVAYRFDDGSEITNKFVQLSLIDKYCSDYAGDDKLTFFLTNKAREQSWEDAGFKQGLIDRGLEKLANPINISDGKTKDELWEIFSKIYENIREEDEIIFDVTHSFRFLPMLAIVVLNYARALKNFTLKNLYYGALDGAITDLTDFDSIFRWSSAIGDFNEYGTAGPITKLLHKDSIEQVSKVLTTVRGQEIASGAVFQDFRNDMAEYKTTKGYSPPFEPVFDLLENKLNAFKPDNVIGNIVASIDWYVKHHLVQQGITMLQEGILTILIHRAGLNYKEKDLREKCSSMIWGWNGDLQEIKKLSYYTDLTKIYRGIAGRRNSISHGGFTPKDNKPQNTPFKANEIIDKLNANFEKLKEALKKHNLWSAF